MSNNSKNDPPVVQVLTAGGAGVRRHKDKVVNKNKKNKSLVPIESNHDNDDEHETTRPLVHWNLSGDGLSSHQQQASLAMTPDPGVGMGLEYEPHEEDPDIEDVALNDEDCEPTQRSNNNNTKNSGSYSDNPSSASKLNSNRSSATKAETMTVASSSSLSAPTAISSELVWLAICFFGIMASFVLYGLLLEYSTSGGRKLHELSFLFVTSGLYTLTAAAGRYVRDETPTTIPPARFAILGLTSMASTWCSIRSLRYVSCCCCCCFRPLLESTQ